MPDDMRATLMALIVPIIHRPCRMCGRPEPARTGDEVDCSTCLDSGSAGPIFDKADAEEYADRITAAMWAEVGPEMKRLRRELGRERSRRRQARTDATNNHQHAEKAKVKVEQLSAQVAEWRRVHTAHEELHDLGEDTSAAWRQRAEQAEADLEAANHFLSQHGPLLHRAEIAEAERDTLNVQVAVLQQALADRGDDVRAFQKACGTHLPEQAGKERAEAAKRLEYAQGRLRDADTVNRGLRRALETVEAERDALNAELERLRRQIVDDEVDLDDVMASLHQPTEGALDA